MATLVKINIGSEKLCARKQLSKAGNFLTLRKKLQRIRIAALSRITLSAMQANSSTKSTRRCSMCLVFTCIENLVNSAFVVSTL